MISSPLWIQKDFGITVSVNSRITGKPSDAVSTLQSSQVLDVSFDASNESESKVVSAKQLRFSSKSILIRTQVVKKIATAQHRSKLVKSEQKEIWRLSRVEKLGSRAPASLAPELINTHELDADEVVSEYIEMDEGKNEFALHFESSTHKQQTRRLSLKFVPQVQNLE